MAFRGNQRSPGPQDGRMLGPGHPRLRGILPGMVQLVPSASSALLQSTPPLAPVYPSPGRPPPNTNLGHLLQGIRGLPHFGQRLPQGWPAGSPLGLLPTPNLPIGASGPMRGPAGGGAIRGPPLLNPAGIPTGPVPQNLGLPMHSAPQRLPTDFRPQVLHNHMPGVALGNQACGPMVDMQPEPNPHLMNSPMVTEDQYTGITSENTANREQDDRSLQANDPAERGRFPDGSYRNRNNRNDEYDPNRMNRFGGGHREDYGRRGELAPDHFPDGEEGRRYGDKRRDFDPRCDRRQDIRSRAERRREDLMSHRDRRGNGRPRRNSPQRNTWINQGRDGKRDDRESRRVDDERPEGRREDGRRDENRLGRIDDGREGKRDDGRHRRRVEGKVGDPRENRWDENRFTRRSQRDGRSESHDRGRDLRGGRDDHRMRRGEWRDGRDSPRGVREGSRGASKSSYTGSKADGNRSSDRRSRKRSPERERGGSYSAGSDADKKRRKVDGSKGRSKSRDRDKNEKDKSVTPPPPGTFSVTLPNRQAMEVLMSLQDDSDDEEEEMNLEGVEDGDGYVKLCEDDDSGKDDDGEPAWIRCSPADLYFRRDKETNCLLGTKKMKDVEDKVENEICKRAANVRASKPKYEPAPRLHPVLLGHHHHNRCCDGGCSSSDSSSEDSDDDNAVQNWLNELNRKKQHPERLHEELWFNEPKEMNDGPLCRCSLKSQETGIRHDVYPGETDISRCDPCSNNSDKLFHYRITMSPHTNFLTKNPTIIEYDNHEYIFEGFSLLSHYKLENVPVCKVIRFNIEYTIHWFEEELPENFTIRSMDLFTDFLFYEVLELVDLDWKPKTETSCSRFHLMPRFARALPDNGKEILSSNEVLHYLLRSSDPLLKEEELPELLRYEKHEWQDLVDKIRGMIVTYPGMRPSSIRIDQLDREKIDAEKPDYPMIIHFGIRPAQLSYAGDPNYQKLWKQYVKYKHLLANKPKVTLEDKQKLLLKEEQLSEMRTRSSLKREVTVAISAKGFVKTGIKSDICQHAMLLPVLIGHLRFHKCLEVLQDMIGYQFKDRMLIQLALTHPSYRVNFGTNPDHARNSLSNCGIRQPEYGDRRIHHVHTRKRGINTLINIMSRLGHKEETTSEINHYERLEFLGDAVVEFMSSIHLFFMFPSLEEGGLATYRAAIVQNQHLSVLAKKLKMQDFMLYAHGPDLCHESDLRHAMANCLEALMGALFLDGGIELADRVFGSILFDEDKELNHTWMNLPPHPLQEDEPNGDRHWIASSPALQKLVKFEEMTGVKFNHIRLLARSFTMRNVGFNNLSFGHNQRLEFLGDTVLQLVASGYLFKHFPEHHEGHLSLLRSSLVNNRTQAVVCDDLGMTDFLIHAEHRTFDQTGMKHKEKADILEAFIGALYVDKGLEYCRVFCHVCFFPRLKQFILNQDWNDPKSQLQQCCLTLRELDGGEPDIPVYKVIASTGPTNTRKYTVAVYFRGERLATGMGHSIQQAEMNAATNTLQDKGDLFPQLAHQKRFIRKKYKMYKQRKKKVPQRYEMEEKATERKKVA